MARWSTVGEENTVDNCKTSKKLADGAKPHPKGEIEKLVLLFRRLLEAFLREFFSAGSFRPLPPMTGDGKTVDLFKLFLNVNDKGGFDAVSENGLWGNVARDSGLEFNHSASAKLMYAKYLDAFVRWLKRVVAVEANCSRLELSGISAKLETELQDFLSEIKRKYEQEKGVSSIESGTGLLCFISELKGRYDTYHNDKERVSIDAVKKVEGSETAEKSQEKRRILDSEARESPCSGKRKRECTSSMLKWLSKVARDPYNPAIGPLPERSKWASYGNDEPWKQALLYRAAMSHRRHTDSPSGKHWERHQKMHPCIYDDGAGPGYNLRERLSFSGSSINDRKAAKVENVSGKNSTMQNSDDEEYPVGSDHQAEVPPWKGVASESDLKWLGTRVWPLDKERNPRLLIERDPIGKGRLDSCGCERPGSVECARFHVDEKRAKLKLELGSAFFEWGFDEMGEAITKIWTNLEQKKVNALIKTPPSLDQSVFEPLRKILPSKNRAKIVSYYYNVILMQYRAKQNRCIPCVIDSDADELDCDSASDINAAPMERKSVKPVLLSPKKPNRQTR